MILAIDIGNTLVHAGVFESTKLIRNSSFRISKTKDLLKILNKLTSNCSIDNIGISSVVTNNEFIKSASNRLFKIRPIFINGKLRLPIKLKVKNKSSIGADRICNAVYGYKIYKSKDNVLIIDAGTAITYDFVLKNGDFLGGAIAPGLNTMAKSLNFFTSKLPLVNKRDLIFQMDPIGNDTINALRSGILSSIIDSIDGMIQRIKDFKRVDYKTILTGGDAQLLKPFLKQKVVIKQNTVLEGINLILQYLNGN